LVAATDGEIKTLKDELKAFESVQKELKAHIKLCMATVVNEGAIQVTSTQKVNIPRHNHSLL